MSKKGDWTCNCGAYNFASRDKCYTCGKLGYQGVRPAPVKKPGDWDCSNCHELNFASRSVCRNCGSAPPKLHEPGDWQCKACNSGDWNFKSRKTCRTCGADRNAPAPTVDEQSECKICMDKPMNIVFTSCGHMACCDVCCHAVDKCPICRAPFTKEQILKVYKS